MSLIAESTLRQTELPVDATVNSCRVSVTETILLGTEDRGGGFPDAYDQNHRRRCGTYDTISIH